MKNSNGEMVNIGVNALEKKRKEKKEAWKWTVCVQVQVAS